MKPFLLYDFYTIESSRFDKETGRIRVRVILNGNHPVFKGHFPEKPVVPGVFMIQMITEILSDYLRKELIIQEISNVKFLNLVDPSEIRKLVVQIGAKSTDNSCCLVEAVISDEKTTVLKFKGRYVFPDES